MITLFAIIALNIAIFISLFLISIPLLFLAVIIGILIAMTIHPALGVGIAIYCVYDFVFLQALTDVFEEGQREREAMRSKAI